ncbi:MAG: PP2C family protein-serine/threonine phosphatase [Endozoicomonas sp. (ex Botrylloides leachii)]|nr:PP2C family protein-serine/threonine phosphatase [Endozoicomonas sp. (ex Botrylloides leachii)]
MQGYSGRVNMGLIQLTSNHEEQAASSGSSNLVNTQCHKVETALINEGYLKKFKTEKKYLCKDKNIEEIKQMIRDNHRLVIDFMNMNKLGVEDNHEDITTTINDQTQNATKNSDFSGIDQRSCHQIKQSAASKLNDNNEAPIRHEPSKFDSSRQVVPLSLRADGRRQLGNEANKWKIEDLEYRLVMDASHIEQKLKSELKHAADTTLIMPKSKRKPELFTGRVEMLVDPSYECGELGKATIGQQDISDNVFVEEPRPIDVLYRKSNAVPCSGVAWSQGKRLEMQDEHIATMFQIRVGGNTIPVMITGVLDGHSYVPQESNLAWWSYAKAHLIDFLKKNLEQFNANDLTDLGIWNALKKAFVELNYEQLPGVAPDDKTGTTANIALQINGDLWVANLGDSRAMLVNKDGEVVNLSEDAVANAAIGEDAPNHLARYRNSVQKRGADVEIDWDSMSYRVKGLSLTRALGDHCADGAISARPKITKTPAAELADKILVQTCDGITDVASSSDIGKVVSNDIKIFEPDAVAARLVARAFKAKSGDNLTAVVTTLQ